MNRNIAFFDFHEYERPFFDKYQLNFQYISTRLTEQTINLALGHETICCFVNDHLNKTVIERLAKNGLKHIVLRCAGYNNVDLKTAKEQNVIVSRVPEYSPYAVAEFTVALILTLNRKIHRSYLRMKEMNFSLNGLMGFDLHGKTAGVVGTGKIGKIVVEILHAFGCNILAYDPKPSEDLLKLANLKYVDLNFLLSHSDIISLHVPLNEKTRHMINANTINLMRSNVMLINTGRGALIDAKSLIEGLKEGKLSSAGLDVYEEEENYFFQDHSSKGIDDDVLARLLTFPNVLITSHQAFLTEEALKNIAETVFCNIKQFEKNELIINKVT